MSELTPEMLGHLYDAPWPATKDELIEYAQRHCCPDHVIEALASLEDKIEYDREDLETFDDDLFYGDDEEYGE